MEKIKTTDKKVNVDIFVKWIMFTAAITGLALLAALYPIQGNIPFIVIPSIFVLIFSKPVFFERMKLTTLVTVRIVIVFAATFTDLIRYKKYFNAVSGFALAIGVIALKGAWQYNAPIGDYYMVHGALPIATILYAIAYTIWNWIFVTNEFSSSVSLMHVGFLSAPLIGSICTLGLGQFGGFGLWLLLRANSLAIGGWMQIAAKDWFEREFYNEKFDRFVKWTKQTPVQIICMIINVSLIAACIVIMMKNGGFHYEFPPFAAPMK